MKNRKPKDFLDIKYRASMFLSRVFKRPFYCLFMKRFGKKTTIYHPLRIIGSRYMLFGKNVVVDKYACLYAFRFFNNNPELQIGDGTRIGHFCHIVATSKVIIGRNVLIADRVFISDNSHKYSDITMPIITQGVVHNGDVTIGDDTWIGENVCILSSKIGKHCVIGANSVVTRDIPDYSIAVGVPAKVIKTILD